MTGAAARRAWVVTLLALFLGAAGGLVVAAAAPTWDAPDLPEAASFRLLATGDTGHRAKRYPWWTPQNAVGAALAASDRVHPADRLVLLGDNFYPAGLEPDEVEARIAQNLVTPFCRFLDLSGPRSAEVAASCPLEPRDRHPIPVRAVLGNHDYRTEESPRLQAEVVPEYVANWRLDVGVPWVEEHEAGVSLIYFDSTPGRGTTEAESLRETLAGTRGPWRIVLAHHPIDASEKGRRIRDAVERSGVDVHLWLAGHEHNLQVAVPERTGPSLQVIAGGGSHATGIKYPLPGRRFFRRSLGYARVDLVSPDPLQPEREELQVALVATRTRPVQFWRRARVVARWSIEADGSAHPIFQARSDPLRREGEDLPDEPLQ